MTARSWLIRVVLGLAALYMLYLVARWGSVGIALVLAVAFALFGLFMFATRKRPGRRYEKHAPSCADADLQTWDSSP